MRIDWIEEAPWEVSSLSLTDAADIVRECGRSNDYVSIFGSARRWWSNLRGVLENRECSPCEILGVLDFNQLMCLCLETAFQREDLANELASILLGRAAKTKHVQVKDLRILRDFLRRHLEFLWV